MKKITSALFCGLLMTAIGGHAHESHRTGHNTQAPFKEDAAEQHVFGRAGNPAKINRRIEIVMDDRMRFSPAEILVNEGEVIEFVVFNHGAIMHEMVLGTRKDLQDHAEMMRKFPGMEHEEAYMAHVAPGKSEKLLWNFNRAGEFEYGCLIPGHFEAGMVGKIKVKAAAKPALR